MLKHKKVYKDYLNKKRMDRKEEYIHMFNKEK